MTRQTGTELPGHRFQQRPFCLGAVRQVTEEQVRVQRPRYLPAPPDLATFNEDKSQVRTHNPPAVLAALRDLIRSALKLAASVNTAAGRRAHTERPRVLALYRIT